MTEEDNEKEGDDDDDGDDINRCGPFLEELDQVLRDIEQSGKRLAGFICEPFMSKSGMVKPPKDYLKVRDN